MTEGLRLCIDCKHHSLEVGSLWTEGRHVCQRETEKSPVTGALKYNNKSCTLYRSAYAQHIFQGVNICGPEGVFWEEKELPNESVPWKRIKSCLSKVI